MKKFIFEHKFLFAANAFSIIISIVSSLLYADTRYPKTDEMYEGLIFLGSFLPVIIISTIAGITFKKYPVATKILSGLLNLLYILIVQIFFGLCIIGFSYFFDPIITYSNPSDYSDAVKFINNKSKIAHFPSKIPQNAKNIYFNTYINNTFGSEEIFLKFNIDNEYIENEINKHKYISIEKPNEYKHNFFNFVNSDADDFTFYVINDRDIEHPGARMFPYHYGIGRKNGAIFYYYSCPD